MKIYDIIYLSIGETVGLKVKYPNAVIVDASDDIHPERFTIDVEIEDEKEYWAYMIREGFAAESLTVQTIGMEKGSPLNTLLNECIKEIGKEVQ